MLRSKNQWRREAPFPGRRERRTGMGLSGMDSNPPKPEQILSPLEARTEGPTPTTAHCQRCKGGVYLPESELKRCPDCARDICRECRTYEPEREAYVCLDCARVRRAKGLASRQERRHWQRALAFLGIVGIGIAVMLLGLTFALGVGLAALGIVGFAWHLVGYQACPLCGGKGVSRRSKGRHQYRCTLCAHRWEL